MVRLEMPWRGHDDYDPCTARVNRYSCATERMSYEVEFSSTLFRIAGKGGWTFAPVPEDLAPSVTEAWGRTPVEATVDGRTWQTSVWRERSGRTLLPVPKHIRQAKEHGETVRVRLRFRHV